MHAHNVVIITSGRMQTASRFALDELIQQVESLRKQAILVLGPDGDEVLLRCPRAERCEIIFDPNYQGNLFSGVKAGLATTNHAAWVVALGEPALPLPQWRDLFEQLTAPLLNGSLKTDLVTPITQDGKRLFPILVTAAGVAKICSLPAATCWETPAGFSADFSVGNFQLGCPTPSGLDQSF